MCRALPKTTGVVRYWYGLEFVSVENMKTDNAIQEAAFSPDAMTAWMTPS